MKTTYEFAIKKDILNSGEEILSPICRKKPKWGLFSSSPWCRIVEIYGVYTLLELDFTPNMTFEECEAHIRGYMDVLKKQIENNVADVVFLNKEEKEL